MRVCVWDWLAEPSWPAKVWIRVHETRKIFWSFQLIRQCDSNLRAVRHVNAAGIVREKHVAQWAHLCICYLVKKKKAPLKSWDLHSLLHFMTFWKGWCLSQAVLYLCSVPLKLLHLLMLAMIQYKSFDTASNAMFLSRIDTFQSAPKKKSITKASVPSSVPLHPESPGLAFHTFHALYQGPFFLFTCQTDGSRSNEGNLHTVTEVKPC